MSGAAAAGGEGGGAGASPPADKWYFTREQLAASPSRQCGLDADKELAYRQQAANLIQDMGQRLQVSQLCINTAIVYMHRFYAFHSFTQFHRNYMAAAALFLAAKVEEQPRKLEHVIKVAHICLHRGDSQPSLDLQSKQYLDQAQDLVFNENVLLQTLGFDVAIDHPHTHVVRTCNLVRASKDLAQTSYFMASNSLHLTTMCLQYRPTVVACFCIHLASKWSNWAIPPSSEGRHWFFYVDRTVSTELLEHLTAEFLHIFDRCPARLKKKIMSISSTQGTNSPQQANSSHSNPSASNSSYDKEPRKINIEDLEKAEAEKRQQCLFGPSTSNSNQMGSGSNKMDYREYKERQQQDRRRPLNLPPPQPLVMPRPTQDITGNSQHRQSSSSGQRPQNIPPSQHRWPPNHRSKDMVSMRPHPSQSTSSSSSSRAPHRSSSSVHPPQISSSQPSQPLPEQKPRSQHPPQQPLLHSSRIHTQPQIPPQQQAIQQPSQPPQYQAHQTLQSQPPQQNIQIPIQQPPQRPPSLFSPEPQRKPPVPRRPPAPILPSKELALPTQLLSPFSSSPPSIPQPSTEIEPAPIIVKKIVEPPPPPVQVVPPPIATNSVETDPTLVSSLLKESLPHRADKKKKKDKHKHKDREKRDERRKHKKDKDKKRESESNPVPTVSAASIPPPQNSIQSTTTPIKITIPREAIANTTPPNPTKLKIKIPKERLRTEPPVPMQTFPPGTAALKIKIPKELVENTRKRSSPATAMMMEGPPHKMMRLPQQSHQQHKVSQELHHSTATGYPGPPPMMYHPQMMMYQHPPPFFFPQQSVYSHPPPVPAVPPLPPLPPPPPPPPPP